jgi:glycerophosphoryl diester phosphodiesterase
VSPLRIAHRGYRTVARENSLGQVQHALELGADYVELDVRRRPDGALVLDHDRGDHPGAPLLAEAMELIAATPAAGADLDLKESGLRDDLVQVARETGMLGRTVCTGGNWQQLAEIKQAEPGIRIGITIPRTAMKVPRLVAKYGLLVQRRQWARRLPGLLKQYDADLVASHHRLVDGGLVRAAHSVGAEIWCWTVDNPRDIARLERLGVDAICSDRPESHGFVWQAPSE